MFFSVCSTMPMQRTAENANEHQQSSQQPTNSIFKLKTACIMAATSLATQLISSNLIDPKVSLFMGIAARLTYYTYDVCKRKPLNNNDIIQNILRHPEIIFVDDIKETKSKFRSVLERQDPNWRENIEINNLKLIISHYEKMLPIFLLDECFIPCKFNRLFNRKSRKIFEQRIVDELLSKLNSSDKPVNYASFASGGAYQDFVIMVKILTQKPDAKIVINLIDLEYSACVFFRDGINIGREIVIDEGCQIDFDSIKDEALSRTLERRKEKGEVISDETNEKFFSGTKSGCIIKEEMFKQFLKFLKNEFKQADISLLIHGNANCYLRYVEEKQIDLPDIIASADIQDPQSKESQAMEDLQFLINSVIEKKPDCLNFVLISNCQSRFGIASFAQGKWGMLEEWALW